LRNGAFDTPEDQLLALALDDSGGVQDDRRLIG
jgi:hypothetical protein